MKTEETAQTGSNSPIKDPRVVHVTLMPDSNFPNNGRLPLLLYQGAVNLPKQDPAFLFEQLFSSNGWGDSWRNGIYTYHHCHTTAHEVLGVYSGDAKVQLGGPSGIIHHLNAGDVVIIPAGVSHKNIGSESDFGVVGAYPAGQSPDMYMENSPERLQADRNIASVPLPERDPVYGSGGPMTAYWGARASRSRFSG